MSIRATCSTSSRQYPTLWAPSVKRMRKAATNDYPLGVLPLRPHPLSRYRQMGPPMVMPAFRRFPGEAAIIGRLLAGYAELEIALLHCVSAVREDFDAVLKAMFRIRGETARINIGDALGRQPYAKLDLGADFELAVSAMRYCLKIRNQYAHCNWYDDLSGRLAFVNVEEIAKGNQPISGFDNLTRRYVDVPSLEGQEKYFGYADALINYANYEGRLRTGKLRTRLFEKPGHMSEPPLYFA
jgi:hypothetical protein